MKHNFSRIMALLLILATLFLTGCGGFFEEEAILIAYVTDPVVLENGNTLVEIYYVDDVLPPTRLEIPQGIQGEDGEEGRGVEKIDPVDNPEKEQIEVRITYTDGSTLDFEVPYGVSVVDVSEPQIDPVTKELYITFLLSNGGSTKPVYLPKGEAGNGIKSFVVNDETEDGSIVVKIVLEEPVGEGEEEKKDTFEFTIPAGKEGKGIEKVKSDIEGEFYYIAVWFTGDDLNSEEAATKLYFPRPKDPNQWYKLAGKPDANYGNTGDFSYDYVNKIIYQKESTGWVEIVSFKTTDVQYLITFDVNVDDQSVVWPEDYDKMSYSIKAGTYFWDPINGNYRIPIPVRPGYTFGGWYLQAIPEDKAPDASMTPFTDTTAVFASMTLYAYWIPKTAN